MELGPLTLEGSAYEHLAVACSSELLEVVEKLVDSAVNERVNTALLFYYALIETREPEEMITVLSDSNAEVNRVKGKFPYFWYSPRLLSFFTRIKRPYMQRWRQAQPYLKDGTIEKRIQRLRDNVTEAFIGYCYGYANEKDKRPCLNVENVATYYEDLRTRGRKLNAGMIA